MTGFEGSAAFDPCAKVRNNDRVKPTASRLARAPAPFGLASLIVALCGGLATGASIAAFLALSSTPEVSTIDRVAPGDIDAAAPSLLGTSIVAAVEDAKACRRPLASVVVSETSPDGGTLRVRSGGYISPKIRLGKNPFKLALPLPAPLEAGAGQIYIESESSGAVVFLRPGVMIPSGTHETVVNVTWKATPSCPSG